MFLANACVLAGAYYYFTRFYPQAAAAPAEPTNQVVAAEAAPRDVQPESPLSNSPPTVIMLTNQFHWREIESADYRTYIANLRKIGCPEATIRDIILTDGLKLFAERRGQVFQTGGEF